MNFLTKKLLLQTLSISVVYVILVVYIMNGKLVFDTIVGNYPLSYKASLSLALLEGMWTSMSSMTLVLLFAIAILTGLNIGLLWKIITASGGLRKIHLVSGGGSVLGIVGSGCAACGLPLLSLLGVSSSIAYLPFNGEELAPIALVLLVISSFILIRNNKGTLTCAVPSNREAILQSNKEKTVIR